MIQIDAELCVGCGMCVKDCVRGCLVIKEPEHKAEMIRDNCMLCGHCEAVCIREAISVEEEDYEGFADFCLEESYLDAEELAMFMAKRRSVRSFQQKPVEQGKIEQIIEAGRFSPTSANKQTIEYIVMKDRLKEIAKTASLALEGEILEKLSQKINRTTLEKIHAAAKEGGDRLFFGAPVVIALTDVNADGIDVSLAASRMELMANALGLGVCFNGIYPKLVEAVPEVRAMSGLEEGRFLPVSMMIGYPTVSYMRPAKRKRATVKTL